VGIVLTLGLPSREKAAGAQFSAPDLCMPQESGLCGRRFDMCVATRPPEGVDSFCRPELDSCMARARQTCRPTVQPVLVGPVSHPSAGSTRPPSDSVPIVRKRQPPSNFAAIVEEVNSGPRPSGRGRAVSSWYSVCSRPLPDDYEIVSSGFTLNGDRHCGGWAVCKKVTDTPDKVCWQFQMQGHEEWGVNEGMADSWGVLKYRAEYKGAPPYLVANQCTHPVVLYLQYRVGNCTNCDASKRVGNWAIPPDRIVQLPASDGVLVLSGHIVALAAETADEPHRRLNKPTGPTFKTRSGEIISQMVPPGDPFQRGFKMNCAAPDQQTSSTPH